MSRTAETPLPALPIERFRLDNGLQVVVQPDDALPLVAINLWVHVGSKDERPGRTGFAHLFEHMLFQGSAHVGTNDHFHYVQQAGGMANGSTWYDRTNYYETLPAHYLDLGLWLESDRMGWLLPAMTQEKLDTQREVVINERRQRVDNQPYGRALERLHELLYPADHPYHWPVIGYVEDIEAATLEDVQAFFRAHYRPDNTVLTLAGAVDPGEARERVERWFGELPRGAAPAAPPVPEPPPLSGERRETLSDDVHLPRVYLGYRTPRYGDRGWYAADLLATALTGDKATLLHEDLVYRRQIAQDVTAYVYPTELAATFLLVATARPGVDPREVEDAIGGHLERVAAEGLDERRVARAHERVQNDYFLAVQKLDGRADLLGQLTTYFDRPERLFEEPAIYRSIGSAEVAAFAAESLRRERRAVVTVVPREGA
ncbi:MAG TPA: pitrilysin family protein [Thermoanaerobaculia bacterium]|nr:pitrilysin family protein [Thermoanaerobaculia bacterium]